jgi:glycosyltransferase involved in cell wall biosynthesis
MPELCGKADILRYEILQRYGGVYVDADSVCVASLDESFLVHHAFASYEHETLRPGLVSNGTIGAEPGAPFLEEILKTIETRELKGRAWESVGPRLLTEFAHDLYIYPARTFLPIHLSGVESPGDTPVHAVQFWGSTSGGEYGGVAVENTNQKVSVVIVCHWQAHDLAVAVGSVRGQTYSPHEIIVVVDDADDESVEEARRLGVCLGDHKDASGDCTIIMNANDILVPSYIETFIGSAAVADLDALDVVVESESEPYGVGLCMIVKNEAHIIERCLMSVRQVISHWTIVDTGSMDGTQDVIRNSRILKGVPGELHERPWKDFASNRNESIELATGKTSHVLVIDADDIMELAENFKMPRLVEDAYMLTVIYGDDTHSRVHIFRPEIYRYVGVLHEYLAPIEHHLCGAALSAPTRRIPTMRIRVVGGGSRSRDPKKFVRDAETLTRALKQDPENSRHRFFLAQSWQYAYGASGDKKQLGLAMEAYKKRATMGGDPEEVRISLFEISKAQEILG